MTERKTRQKWTETDRVKIDLNHAIIAALCIRRQQRLLKLISRQRYLYTHTQCHTQRASYTWSRLSVIHRLSQKASYTESVIHMVASVCYSQTIKHIMLLYFSHGPLQLFAGWDYKLPHVMNTATHIVTNTRKFYGEMMYTWRHDRLRSHHISTVHPQVQVSTPFGTRVSIRSLLASCCHTGKQTCFNN